MMTLKHIVLFAVIAFFCIQTLSAFTLTKRSLSSNASANTSSHSTSQAKRICQGRTPCGWAVYNRGTRYIDYFMRNTCDCSSGKDCLRDEDDISITAYVYRCRPSS